MNALYPQNLFAYFGILMVMLRFLGLFLLAPGFSHKAIPVVIRVSLAFSLSLALYPILKKYLPPFSPTLGGIAGAVFRETAVGLLLSFSAYVTFEAISLGAQFIGYQVGLGTAGLIDPQNQANVSVLVPLQGWIVLLVFLLTDMHHSLIEIMVKSFEITAPLSGEFWQSPDLLKNISVAAGQLFVIAVQVAAPFTVLTLAANAAIGLIARLIPQVNMLLFSFPILILIVFGALFLVMPDLIEFCEAQMGNMLDSTLLVMRGL